MTTCPIIVCSLGRDHLYDSCPHLAREREMYGSRALPCLAPGCDPLDESVCGWCRRVWKARHAS